MTAKTPSSRPVIAVVGVSALFPGSQDSTGFWNDILAGTDLISDVPDTHWLPEDYYDPDPSAQDKTYARRGGFLSPVDFDALSWGVPPSIIEATDTSQLLALIVAESVLRDATGGQFDSIDRSRMSVILGVTSAQELLGTMVSRLQRPIWQKSLREAGIGEDQVQEICQRISDHYVPWQESSFPGLLGNVVAGRIANRLDLGGTNCVTDAACASTFSALSMAVRELYLGDSDLVITGGVDTLNDIFMFMCFSKTPALSPSGDCRPFSDQADGTMLGEGLGMVALKRLDDAERDGDRVYAVITGVGSSSDGRSKSVYAPVPEGQAKSISRAYAIAGYGPSTVEMVEGHGTGTKAGDAAEFGGLSMVFDPSLREQNQWCALGSVKSQIGHTKAAAGAAGLFKAVMALHHKVLPPTIKVDKPNPSIDLENSAFHINSKARPWIRPSDHPRRASVSSFGFGGSNFHVALEEYLGPDNQAARLRCLPVEIIAISATDGESIATLARALAERASSDGMLSRLAWETAHSFEPTAQARLAVVASSADELKLRLLALADTIEGQPTKAFDRPDGCSYGVGSQQGGVAFMFPGQGSQYLGMGASLAMHFDAARGAWDRASDITMDPNRRLDQVVYPFTRFDDGLDAEDAALLRATQWAQPAIGATSLSLLALLSDLGIQAEAVAGHSFGEVSALHAAGVLSEQDLLKVARKRGELMAAASDKPGAMSAVTASVERVEAVIKTLSRDDVVVANHNAPTQVVISGSEDGIEAAEDALNKEGLRAQRLPVSTAFHSPMVADSSLPFAEFLDGVDFAAGTLPCWSGESAALYESGAAERRQRLAQQIARPVHFVDLVSKMADSGIHTFIEVGPGAVLTGLVGNSLKGREHRALALDRRGRSGIESFLRGLSQLVAGGTSMDLTGLWKGYAEPIDVAARKKPKLAVPIAGSNHGKVYPPKGGAAALPGPNPNRPSPVANDHAMSSTVSSQAPQPKVPAATPVQPQASAVLNTAPVPTAHSTVAVAHPPMETAMNPHTAPAALPAGWLEAWQEAQRQNTAAHTAFQSVMAESHGTYLRSMETTIAALAGLSGLPTSSAHAPQFVRPAPVVAAPVVAAPVAAAVPAPVATPTPFVTAPVAPAPIAPAPVVVVAAVAAAPAAPAAPSIDLHALMLDVVADKTGYPAEMLEVGMDLEGDLGIDSIKRVEILAAVQDQAPGMPEVDASHMGSLRTLGEIVEYMQGLMGQVAAPAVAAAPAAPAASSASAAPSPDLGRFALEMVPAPSVGFAQTGLFGADEVLITSDGGALAGALAGELRSRGVNAQASDSIEGSSDAVIFLGGLRAVADIDAAIATQREAYAVARTIAPKLTKQGGLFVTVQDTGGAFGTTDHAPERAWLGGLPALVKTASQEWPTASLKAIDLERGNRDDASLAKVLADELLLGGGELEVGLNASGDRVTPRAVAYEVQRGQPVISEGDVVVVSGGARGVTSSCIIRWAADCRARFVLLGRSALSEEPTCCAGITDDAGLKRALLKQAQSEGAQVSPAELSAQVRAVLSNREIRATVVAIEAAGGEARYRSVDVTDGAAVDSVLAETRNDWGPIKGLVHGAGVLADRLIAEQTDEQFDRIFNTKIEGLRTLLSGLAQDPLAVMCMFSSVSARCGNNGQSTYAMANEILNKVSWAESRGRGGEALVKSLGWGPWEGGMVSPALREHFASLGVPMIPLDLGATMLADELCGAQPGQVELVLGGEPRPEALLVVGADERKLNLEVTISHNSHAYLTGHAIEGEVVVPVVLALEWFSRMARAFRPDLQLQAINDLKVLKGIQLRGFAGEGDRFVLSCAQLSNGHGSLLGLELSSADGTLHYRAQAQMVSARTPAANGSPSPALNDWGGAPVYGDVLFHTDNFQVIEDVDGVGECGISGTLNGVESAQWSWEHWNTDVAALDGGLQMLLLWARERMGGAALPMGIGQTLVHAETPPTGSVTCVAHCRSSGKSRGLADISFADENGVLFTEFKDVELILRPSSN